MGYYLNSSQAFSIYESETKKPYFVDKSAMLRELIPLVDEGNNHICITRPRRFGKSVMAAMVGAFFGRGQDSSGIFKNLEIAGGSLEKTENTFANRNSSPTASNITVNYDYRKYINQYNVIYINFINPANLSSSYAGFIKSIEMFVIRDLRQSFPNVDYWNELQLSDFLGLIYEETKEKFILVFDEWDCIFHKDYINNEERKKFINWLAALTKDKGYIVLSYMTGILPIAKYSSGSTINNFDEYTMIKQPKFSEYFGFTEQEVDMLYERYLKKMTLVLSQERILRFGMMAIIRHLVRDCTIRARLSRLFLIIVWPVTGPRQAHIRRLPRISEMTRQISGKRLL